MFAFVSATVFAPATNRFALPDTTPPSVMFPAAALIVWAPLKTIGTFSVWGLPELLVTPAPVSVSVWAVLVMVKLLAPLLKVTESTL